MKFRSTRRGGNDATNNELDISYFVDYRSRNHETMALLYFQNQIGEYREINKTDIHHFIGLSCR